MTQIVVSTDSDRALIQELQHYLSQRAPTTPVSETGVFDDATIRALADYRLAQWLPTHRRRETAAPGYFRSLLPMDDACDLTTWNALHEAEAFSVRHSVNLVHQRSEDTGCEMASLAMVLGHAVELERPLRRGEAAPWTMRSLPPGHGHADDGTGRWYEDFAPGAIGLAGDADEAHRRMAERLGLRYLPQQRWTPNSLATVLRAGAIMVSSHWTDEDSGAAGNHAWVLAGMRGDGSEAGTCCLRYDPMRLGAGAGVQTWNYDDLVAEFQTPFRQMIQGPARLMT